MNKFILVAVFATAAFAVVSAAPADEFEPLEVSEGREDQVVDGSEDHLRFRRVTCDLMSFKGAVGHSACAANCLSMGKAGGSCNHGVCQCRKTTFKDLWNKRFG